MEYTNLAGRANVEAVKRELSAWLPKQNAQNAPYDKKVKRSESKKKAKTS